MRKLTLLVLAFPFVLVAEEAANAASGPLASEREQLIQEIAAAHGLSQPQIEAVRAVFASSPFLGTGNPAVSRHPVTREMCLETLGERPPAFSDPTFRRLCGEPFMAPLYDPSTETIEEARACIDQLEYPGIPCAYPVVWVRASEAAQLCEAMGKRLCDAHEWEGACAGALEPPDYRFELAAGAPSSEAVARMRSAHNRAESARKSWSYGAEPRRGICAAASVKSDGCDGGNWKACGSNTYPSGYFGKCRSPLGVYDLHGNAAEHMSLPLAADQMASRGSETLGVTEMKGSWFIFDHYQAHEDWCRWRAPFWHGSRVRDPKSHHNYHLGFRCCKTIRPGAGE